MGVYIKNWSLADWKELLKWAKIGANNAMIGEFTEVEEVPHPHGRLIDADALSAKLNTMLSMAFGEGNTAFHFAYRSLGKMVENAPTIIPAGEGE